MTAMAFVSREICALSSVTFVARDALPGGLFDGLIIVFDLGRSSLRCVRRSIASRLGVDLYELLAGNFTYSIYTYDRALC